MILTDDGDLARSVVSLIAFPLQTLIFTFAPEMKLRWELRGQLALVLFTVSSIIQIPTPPPQPPPTHPRTASCSFLVCVFLLCSVVAVLRGSR